VKHERNNHFNEATLRNALYSVAGLLSINYFYCRLELTRDKSQHRYQYRGQSITKYLVPASVLLRFESDFYYNPISEFAGYMFEDVGGIDERD